MDLLCDSIGERAQGPPGPRALESEREVVNSKRAVLELNWRGAESRSSSAQEDPMKKRVDQPRKRLVLSTETLRQLSESNLRTVRGGLTYSACDVGVPMPECSGDVDCSSGCA